MNLQLIFQTALFLGQQTHGTRSGKKHQDTVATLLQGTNRLHNAYLQMPAGT